METLIESRPIEKGLRSLPIEPFEPPKLDLFDLALALAARKRLIIGMTLLGSVLAAILAFNMPNMYSATAVIMPPAQQRSSLASLFGALAPAAGAMAGGAGGDLLRSPSDLYMALLSSRSVMDPIVEEMKLAEYYESKTFTAARLRLMDRTKLASGKDTLIQITVQDPDPAKAAAIANAYIDNLYKLNSRLAVTESAQRRVFFEKQLEAEKKELADAEAAMKGFQERTGLVQVASQSELVIRTIAQLKAEITSREVALEGIQYSATDQNPEVGRLRTEIASLKGRLRQMESSAAKGGAGLAASGLPGAGLDYMRALRQLRYHESLYEVLARQLESARIDEAKQATVVQVVDYAKPPEMKSGPRRLAYVLAGGLSQAILAACIVLTRKTLAEPARSVRFETLINALWERKSRR